MRSFYIKVATLKTKWQIRRLRSSLLLCTADGVALGAAATTDQAGVEMIVFIAIMLHKVPQTIAAHKYIHKMTVDAC